MGGRGLTGARAVGGLMAPMAVGWRSDPDAVSYNTLLLCARAARETRLVWRAPLSRPLAPRPARDYPEAGP